VIALQSPAERRLISALQKELPTLPQPIRLLDVGANTSIVIETALQNAGIRFIADRIDVLPCELTQPYPWLGKAYQASVEDMTLLSTQSYQAAFANFVFEHIEHLDKAAQEVARILVPQGLFVCTVPNPQAPEFWISRHTPQWFHQYMKGHGEGDEAEAHHTHYEYASVRQLISTFEKSGLKLERIWYDPTTYVYLHRFPVIKYFSRMYDWCIRLLGWKRLLGAVCLVFKKGK
jgi:ubiquinone/menaquinone biosynthesis C-methylase UbiE